MDMDTYFLSRIISTMMRSSLKRLVRPTFPIANSVQTDEWNQCSTAPVIMDGVTAPMALSVIMCVLSIPSFRDSSDIITTSLLA